MFIARAKAAITHTMYQMIYPSESNSERFNLFLCHVLLCISVAPYLTRLRDSDSLTNGFLSFFYLWARELKLVSFLPNFDVIRTKQTEMEPVYKPCFGRGKI